MFRVDKSIGPPLESAAGFSNFLEEQSAVSDHTKTFATETLTGRFSLDGCAQQRFESLAGNPSRSWLQAQPAMQGTTQESARFSRKFRELQRAVFRERPQFGEPRLEGVVVLFQQRTGERGAGERIALRRD